MIFEAMIEKYGNRGNATYLEAHSTDWFGMCKLYSGSGANGVLQKYLDEGNAKGRYDLDLIAMMASVCKERKSRKLPPEEYIDKYISNPKTREFGVFEVWYSSLLGCFSMVILAVGADAAIEYCEFKLQEIAAFNAKVITCVHIGIPTKVTVMEYVKKKKSNISVEALSGTGCSLKFKPYAPRLPVDATILQHNGSAPRSRRN